jgi:hypothetical protein
VYNISITKDHQISTSEAKVLQILGDRIHNLQSKQSLNHNDLPLSYIDPQAVIATGLVRDMSADEINSAIIPIDYLEGYPVVSGLPFWEKLDGELLYFYRLFQSYRDMRETSGSRSLQKISDLSSQPFSIINNIAKAYHWTLRVKSYDMYREFQLDQIRRTNIQKMENKHHSLAETAFTYIQSIIEDLLINLKANPKSNKTPEYQTQLRLWFREIVKLERLSLGLSVDKPGEVAEAASNIITNYNLSQNDNRQVHVGSNKATEVKPDKMKAVLDVLDNAGVLDQMLETKKPSGGNGHKKGNLIDIKGGADA